MSGFIPYGQSHDNTTRKNIDRLLHYTRHDGPLMLPVKAHNETILIHANTLPNKMYATRAVTTIKTCQGMTPATVQSVATDCSIIPNSLLGMGSRIEIKSTVNRTSSGMRGLWHLIKVLRNSNNNRSSSVNTQTGVYGWIRDNKLYEELLK